MLGEILRDRLFLVLTGIYVVVGLSYPLTFTWDSGQYMFLADVVADRAWAAWDPVRGIVFPLFLDLSTMLLGRSQNALLLPILLSQLVLFLLATFFMIQSGAFLARSERRIAVLVVFTVVMLDPIVMGYYHVVLTEFAAATLAIVSCYCALRMYEHAETLPELSRPLILSYLYAVVAVPVAWHLKQPYVGAALFPFLLGCMLVVARKRTGIVLAYVAVANLIILATLGASIVAWRAFLDRAGMPAKPSRELASFMADAYQKRATLISSWAEFVTYVGRNYLAASNILLYDAQDDVVLNDIGLARALENSAIAYRMFDLRGETNIFHMPSEYRDHVDEFEAYYLSPVWLTVLQRAREAPANAMFSGTYLLLPLIFTWSLIRFIRGGSGSVAPIVVCSGSAFVNAAAHSTLIILPLDRYLFWGYPLGLTAIAIGLAMLLKMLMRVIKKTRYASL